MKLFVIGYSKVGKTTACKKLVAAFPNILHIQASTWIKLSNPQLMAETDDEYRFRLVKVSTEILAKNPDACISYLRKCLPKESGRDQVEVVIEGIRNPRDLVSVLAPKDKVVFVKGVPPTTLYERDGLKAIYENIVFLRKYCGFQDCQYTLEKQHLADYLLEYTRPRNEPVKES